MSILSFPVETLQEIFSHIPSSLPTLRFVCKRFNDAAFAQLFHHITIRYKTGRLDFFLDMLNALANKSHLSVVHAKSVTIRELGPPPPREETDLYSRNEAGRAGEREQGERRETQILQSYFASADKIKELLPVAIGRFLNADEISWIVDEHSSTGWSRRCVTSGLSQVPRLTALSLNITKNYFGPGHDNLPIHLPSLSTLKFLKIKTSERNISPDGMIRGIPELIANSSTQLTDLDIRTNAHYTCSEQISDLVPFLQYCTSPLQLTHLGLKGFYVQVTDTITPHLQLLESIHIEDAWDPYERKFRSFNPWFDDDWVAPPKPEVRPEEIWDGLRHENIHLRKISFDDPTESFISYLQSYSGLKSLELGHCSSKFDELAPVFYNNALQTHIASLEHLTVSAIYEGPWCFGDHATHGLLSLTNLRYLSIAVTCDLGEDQEYDPNPVNPPYDPMHSVCRLMEFSSALPNLEVLSIQGAEPRENDSYTCIQECHSIPVGIQIDTHVRNFKPPDPLQYRYDIQAGGRWYRLLYSGEEGGFMFRCI